VEESSEETPELMTAPLDKRLQFVENLHNEIKRRYPGMDPEWGVNRFLQKYETNVRDTANIIALWMPEIILSHEAMEKEHAKTKAH
jgi:hypothetical protein